MSARLLLDAVDFAARRHRDQRRKDPQASPYVNHPIEVARILARVAGVEDAEVLAAAILHDTVEDTETSAAEIEAAFGPRVRALVEAVTDDKSLPKLERKRRQIEHAARLSDDATRVKLADKIANVADVARAPPRGWSTARRVEYLDWAAAVVDACRRVDPALERRFAEVLAEARAQVEATDGP